MIHFSPRKCIRARCSNRLFVSRVNRNGIRISMCEEHWDLIELAIDLSFWGAK